MYESILDTIGHTPLVRLSRVFADHPVRLFGKLESFNPGGSLKDRAARGILSEAMARGLIRPGTTIIESSSGNMGIGLAQACNYLKLPFICVVDPKTTGQNIAILRAYGARIDMVAQPDPATGEFLSARIQRVQELLRQIPDSWWPDQYSNVFNARAHHQTMREICEALGGAPDYLFCATSTCGTLRGCAEYAREQDLHTTIVAVDAVGSVIFGSPARRRLVPGHGAARRPELYQPDLAAACVHVEDSDCVAGCRRLLQSESILAGGSSGAIISAVERSLPQLPPAATVVAVLCDRGERYLDTIYNDAWVRQHFGAAALRLPEQQGALSRG